MSSEAFEAVGGPELAEDATTATSPVTTSTGSDQHVDELFEKLLSRTGSKGIAASSFGKCRHGRAK